MLGARGAAIGGTILSAIVPRLSTSPIRGRVPSSPAKCSFGVRNILANMPILGFATRSLNCRGPVGRRNRGRPPSTEAVRVDFSVHRGNGAGPEVFSP